MNIVYATSDLYSHPALISIKTLLINNVDADEINIYHIGNGISSDNKSMLIKVVSEYGRKLVFIDMPDYLNEIGGLLRTNPIVYSYCCLQDILPIDVDKVLLLEGDTIVTGNLKEFFDLPVDDYYLAASDDLQSKWFKRRLGMKDDSVYFNCGVMLINLKKWRDNQISESLFNMVKSGEKRIFYEVQDELNVFFENEIKVLPPRFNCTTAVFLFDYKNMIRYRRPSSVCSQQEFVDGKENPIVVHFTKNLVIQSRPWVEDCVHPYNQYYLNIKVQTDLKDEPLWPTDRGKISKIVFKFYKRGYKTFLATMLGLVHAFLYPVFSHRLRK